MTSLAIRPSADKTKKPTVTTVHMYGLEVKMKPRNHLYIAKLPKLPNVQDVLGVSTFPLRLIKTYLFTTVCT